jgi:hypothetical protein
MSRAAIVLTLLLASFAVAQESPVTGVQYGPAPFQRQSPQMASDGTNFLVAWRDERDGNGSGSVFAARISPDGRLLDEPTAIGIPDGRDRDASGYTNSPPAVMWTGSVFVVAWSDPVLRAMQLVRIDRDGRVLDARPRTVSGDEYLNWNASASTGDRSLIVRGSFTADNGSDVLCATLLDSHGDVLIDRISISRLYIDSNIVVASNGSGFLVGWLRWMNGGFTLMLAPVSRDGVLGAAREAGLTTAEPLIAANGGDYLVAYANETTNVTMRRFDANGNARGGASTLAIKRPQQDVSLYAAMVPYGGGYLYAYTVWQDRSLHALLVDRDGGFLEWRSLNKYNGAEDTVALGTNGSATAVAWTHTDSPLAPPYRMYARIVESQSDDTLLSRSAPFQSKVRAATNGNGYLAAFTNWPAGSELRVARVNANGERLDAEGIFIDDEVRQAPQVAFDGSNYVVAWMRGDDAGPLRMTRVAPDGTLLDGVRGKVVVPSCTAFGIGSNGAGTLFVWNTFNGPSAIRAQRMKQDGTLDPAVMQLPSREQSGSQFSVAWSRGTWLVAWRESQFIQFWQSMALYQYNVLAARISDGGTVLDGVSIVIAESPRAESAPVVAANGRDFLVAWRESRDASSSAILARHVGVDGVAGNVIEVGLGAGRNAQVEELSAAVANASYIVAWEDAGDLFYSTIGSGIRMPLAASRDDERSPMLLPKPEGFTAFYERIATEGLYGGIPRAFFRFVGIAPRNRAVRH